MSVVSAVRDALLCAPLVTAYVGTVTATARVYTAYRPNISNETCVIISAGSATDVNSSFGRTDRLRKIDIDLDCMASTMKNSRLLAEAVRKSLHGASGVSRSVRVIEIRIKSDYTTFDLGADADDQGVHITTVKAEVTYVSDAVSPISIVNPDSVP